MSGWICWYKDTFSQHLFQEKRVFSKLEAWLYLLSNTHYIDTTIILNSQPIALPRGSFATTLRELSASWDWSVTRTKRFLTLLELDKKILLSCKLRKFTVIQVLDFNRYQKWMPPEDSKKTEKMQRKTTEKTRKPQPHLEDCPKTSENQHILSQFRTKKEANKDSTKNNKEEPENEKNTLSQERGLNLEPPSPSLRAKQKYGSLDNVLLTTAEYDALLSKLGQQQSDDYIERLSLYAASSGRGYKNHYATVLQWFARDCRAQKDKPDKEIIRRSKFQNYEPRQWDYEKIEQLATERL